MVVYLPLLNVLRLTTFLRQTPQSDEPGLRTEYNFPLLLGENEKPNTDINSGK